MKATLRILVTSFSLIASVALAGENGSARPSVGQSGIVPAAGASKTNLYEVEVRAEGLAGARAVHFDLRYNASGLSFLDWTPGDLFRSPSFFGPFDRKEKQVVDVTLYSSTNEVATGSGLVGTVRFQVMNEALADVALDVFQTGDSHWEIDTQLDRSAGVEALPKNYRLIGNSPNPFNPVTKISYEIPRSGETTVEVFDVTGRLVATLFHGPQGAGHYEITWSGRSDRDRSVSSGIYFYRLRSGEFTQTKKMILIR